MGTPTNEDGQADLSYVRAVADDIAGLMQEPKFFVLKSTVPAGTGNKIFSSIISARWKGSFEVVSNPEFLREGVAVADFLHPDRIIIGANSRQAANDILELYKGIDCPTLITTIEDAEVIKYASNAFLATKISFINEIANLCELVNADIEEVARGLGLDSRIGPAFLEAGMGYGGSCLPKDTKALYRFGETNDYHFKILQAVIDVNAEQKLKVIKKIRMIYPSKSLVGKTIAVLGLAFKENTDDVRHSVAIEVIKYLEDLKAVLKVFDPKAMAKAKDELPKTVLFCHDAYEALAGSDVLVLATPWPEFKKIDWVLAKQKMRNPIIIDGRNILNPRKIREIGFHYMGIGRRADILPTNL